MNDLPIDLKEQPVKIESKIKNVRPIDWFIIALCLVVVIYCFYTLHTLNKIEDKAVNKCNEHWVKEIGMKCANDVVANDFRNEPTKYFYNISKP